jgi:MerR family transcriptional regulator, thiopeptide resistance regulator
MKQGDKTMTLTVKELAKLSGVSVRTLHWYDEIGLLMPEHVGENHYRYYEQEQLLQLQQVLFFRELGFTLRDIKKLLAQTGFDKLNALSAHRRILEDNIARQSRLLETIDKTISHLKGEIDMERQELYYGFDSSRQKEYEQYIVTYQGLEAENLLKESKRRTAKWDGDEWDKVKAEGDAIHKALAHAIDEGLSPESDEVQAIIAQHYQLQNRFYEVSKEVYIGLTELYAQHPDFKKFFDAYHPRMIEYIGKAMRYYADKNL